VNRLGRKAVQLPRNAAVITFALLLGIGRSPWHQEPPQNEKPPGIRRLEIGEFGYGLTRHIERCIRSGTVRLLARLPDPPFADLS
jgi:hypothetical protein